LTSGPGDNQVLPPHGGWGYIDKFDGQGFRRDAKPLEVEAGSQEAVKVSVGL